MSTIGRVRNVIFTTPQLDQRRRKAGSLELVNFVKNMIKIKNLIFLALKADKVKVK